MRLLVISTGEVGAAMAGNAIRSYELARALRAHGDVTLAGIAAAGSGDLEVPLVTYTREDVRPLKAAIARADAVLSQPQWPLVNRWLRVSGARLICDLYDPEPFEVAEFTAGRSPALRSFAVTLTIDRVLGAMHGAHHAICASETQRDLWLGAMLAERVIAPARYDADPALRSVLDAVPFGVPDEAPDSAAGAGPRAAFRQLQPDDEIILWNGGIWSWLDAPAAIRALAVLRERRPNAKLVFMGGGGEQAAGREAARSARELAAELGLVESAVFFAETWIAYAERASWLLEADCAVSAQSDHLETRFAFRTRMLDCFWAGLPVVCTAGDSLADRVARDDLGATAPRNDPDALADALERVLANGKAAYAPQLAAAADEHRWPRVVEPIARWLAEPLPASRIGAGAHLRPGHALRSGAFAMGHGLSSALGLKIWPRL